MKNKNKKNNLIIATWIFCILFITISFSSENSINDTRELENEVLLNPISSTIEPTWNVTWHGSQLEDGKDVVTDNAGNVYMAGDTRSYGPAPASSCAFVVKYDPNGIQLWNNTFGEISWTYGRGVAVDDNGNVYLTGYTNSYLSDYQAFLVKYSASGSLIWNKTFGWAGTDYISSIALNGSEHIFIAGYNLAGAFFVKYDNNGNYILHKIWSTPIDDYCNDILINGNDIYITGLNDTGGSDDDDAFLAKFTGDPVISVWNRSWGKASQDDGAYGMTLDNNGRIAIIGRTEEYGQSDYLILQYDPNGDLYYEMIYGGADAVWGYDIVFDDDGNFYVGGNNYGTDIDAELIKFSPTYEHIWNISWGHPTDPDWGYGVALNGSDYIYLCGSTSWAPEATNDAYILQISTNIIPDISKFADFQYEYSSTDNNITWTITDPDVSSPYYTIFTDNSPGSDISWISGEEIEISADGLDIGIHNITIVARDGLGQINQSEVKVTVYNIDPVVSHPEDYSYVFGDSGNIILWDITDNSIDSSSFSVVKNDNEINSSSWISGDKIMQEIDGLPVGSTNFTIIIDDGLGGIIQDEVIITVTNDLPVISHPEDLNYEIGDISNIISWTATDASINVTTYTITKDGQEIASGTWVSGVTITINVDGLAVGTYDYTIIIDDGSGQTIEDSVTVTVLSATTGLGKQIIMWIAGGTVSAITGITIRGIWKKMKKKKQSKKNNSKIDWDNDTLVNSSNNIDDDFDFDWDS